MSCAYMNTECNKQSSDNFALNVHVKKRRVSYNAQMKHRLKEIRKLKGLTQTEMAELMGLSLRGYVYIEQGERELQLKHIRTASQKLDIPEGEFFEYSTGVDPSLIDKLRMLNDEQRAAFEAMVNAMIKDEK